jgi:putative Mg2+ transporter-C (MgtC) family protein
MDTWTATVRLTLALLMGGMLGLERELRGQAAGLRTHILVSLGSCAFTLASVHAADPLWGHAPDGVEADVTRIASQVVVGIGFLGGGAILHHGASVRGLTTAANLWLTASVGMLVGLNNWAGGLIATLLALVALSGLKPVERWVVRKREERRKAGNPPEDNENA